MLTYDQAKQFVQPRLDLWATENGDEVAIIDSATLERPFGRVFFYQSKGYLMTGNFLSLLAGNAPMIVNRHTGEILSQEQPCHRRSTSHFMRRQLRRAATQEAARVPDQT